MAHEPAPGEPDPQRPVRGWNAPPGSHDRHADRARIRRDARTTRTSAAPSPEACRRDRAHAGRGGVIIPPTRLDDATLESLVSRMRNRRTPRRPARPARRQPPGRDGSPALRARGRARVTAAMDELLAYSERVVRAAIRELPDGRFEGADRLETPLGLLDIRAAVTVSGDSIDIDFAGTAPQYEGNLNCPLAVTRSACFYVVRCLTAPTCRRRAAPSRPSPCARPRARSSTRARRLPSRPGTRRRRAASRTSSSTRSRKRSPCPLRARGR